MISTNKNKLFQLSLGVEDGILQSYNQDFELQFAHKISQMMRFSQADLDPCTFLYLLRDDFENLLYCYLFQAKKVQDVSTGSVVNLLELFENICDFDIR